MGGWHLSVELFETLLHIVKPQPLKLYKFHFEVFNFLLGTLNGASQQKDDLHNFLVLCDNIVEGLLLGVRVLILGVQLVPTEEFLGAS